MMQVEINEKMRGILIDWLVEVHLKFKVRRRQQQQPTAADNSQHTGLHPAWLAVQKAVQQRAGQLHVTDARVLLCVVSCS